MKRLLLVPLLLMLPLVVSSADDKQRDLGGHPNPAIGGHLKSGQLANGVTRWREPRQGHSLEMPLYCRDPLRPTQPFLQDCDFATSFLFAVFLDCGQPRASFPTGVRMDYELDLDPEHSVIRVTVTAETMTFELAEEIYRHLSEVTSRGGPYAAIYDLSAVKFTTLPTDRVRSFARRRPSIPMGRKHVVVGKEPHISGLARLFQMCSESIGEPAGFVLGRLDDSDEIHEYQVVYSLEEAYDIVGARSEDFTECLVWPSESTQPKRSPRP